MARQRIKSNILLDWFTVRYRTLWIGGTVAVTLLAIGVWAYLGTRPGPRAEAAEAISRAEERLQQVASLEADERIGELKANAASALDEARRLFGDKAYDDSRRAAIRSEDLSQKALELSQGGGSEREVRLYRFEGDVRVKRAGEFSWEPANKKMTLHIGDQIKTSASASAQIMYFDGTVTTIQPASLLEIRDLYEDPATKVRRVSEKLNWGEVLASSQKRNPDGSVHEVSTEAASAKVTEPGEVRVAFDRERRTASFDVFQGRVEVASASRRESLDAGQRIQSAADGTLSAKLALPPAPRLVAPSDQRVFVYDAPEKQTTTLSWERVPEAARYHLMISDRPLFTDPLYDDPQRKETSVLIEGIAASDYYWKVASINAAGIEGAFSGVRRFRVTSERIRDRGDTSPPPLEITEFVQTGSVVIINGKTEPGALLWVDNEKIEVTENGTFYAVVRLRKEGENTLVLLAQDAAGNTRQLTRTAVVETF